MLKLIITYLTYCHLIFSGFTSDTSPRHEFYLSLCELSYNETLQSLEISIRLFNDDLEKAVFNFNKGRIYDANGRQSAESNKKIEEYIRSKFSIRIDNKQVAVIEFIGWETQDGAAWCYFEIKQVANFKTITISNSLMVEMFERQKNLIYLRKNSTEKSLILDKDKTFSTIII